MEPPEPTTLNETQYNDEKNDERISRMVLSPSHEDRLPVHNSADATEQNTHGFIGRLHTIWQSFEKQLIAYNLEARGIQRVSPSERHDLHSLGYIQVSIMWFSINLAANNITLGMLGPSVFSLGFLDSCLCAVFGMLVGCLAVGFNATFGPLSGNRTMVFSRYIMGWWPSKIVVVLNIIVLLGYSLIDCVVAGQILSAISPSKISVVVGIIVVALISWTVTTFGYQVFHIYQRYAWIPQLIVLSILAGVAGPKFNISSTSILEGRSLHASRLSFFGLNLAAAITYSGGAADYLVYYPPHSSRSKIFFATMAGLTTSFTFAFLLGIGLASGMATSPSWSTSYSTSQGALIVEGFRPLGSFGDFCSVVVTLGLVANLVVPTYSAGIDAQILGTWASSIPRVVWNTVGVVIYTVCALAGRAHLAEIFTNFLALMGYWVSVWMAIVLAEVLFFRRETKFDWAAWNQPGKLPLGIAAFIAFVVGWVGAILGMAQVWYVGPIAKLVGEHGADVSVFLSCFYGYDDGG